MAVNELQYDVQQVKVVKELQKLQKKLNGYQPYVPGLMDKVKTRGMYACFISPMNMLGVLE